MDDEIAEVVRQYGWYAANVSDHNPSFIYTIGLMETCRHPEFIIFGLDSNNARALFSGLIRRSVVSATAGKVNMIELTDQQLQAMEKPDATPPRLVNPRTMETFVLLRVDEYERLKEDEYDDSPWTKEELQALAWEAGKQAGWEDMDEYDDDSEES
jgi:hypothetical protein